MSAHPSVETEAPASPDAPPWVRAACTWTWSKVTGTTLGFAAFLILIYALPYGLALAAFASQAISWGDFVVLATLALVATTFASSAPAPTPLLGTAAMALVGLLGAGFSPVVIGLAASLAAISGFVLGYAFGLGGVGPLLAARIEARGGKDPFRRPMAFVGRRGAMAVFLVSAVPTPISSWIPLAAGAANLRFTPFMIANVSGNTIRWCALAFLGAGVARLMS
ncbi:MAG: DedA family protein [Miltoncostaeaceae bacterium]